MPTVSETLAADARAGEGVAVQVVGAHPQTRLLIVGGGMAGFALCDRLVRAEVLARFTTTLIGEEPRPAYDRVHLSHLFRGKSAQQLQLADADWYRHHQIELKTGCRIVAIDREAAVAIDQHGGRIAYDQLVLATGSRAWVPPIPGVDSTGVFVYRTVDDLERIHDYINRRAARRGAVIGGGLLGLEAAQVLLDAGLATSVIEMAPGLMPRQLDHHAAALLRRHVEDLGVDVGLVRRTDQIEPLDDGRLRLTFANAADLDVDLLIVAAGVRPNDELARQSGLAIGPRGGIVIDKRLATSDPRIFAIGECACFRDHVYGLVAPCYRMADVLAHRLGGGDAVFAGADESAELKLLGVQVAALGRAIGDSPSGVTLTQRDEQCYRKLILEQGRVVGAACVGTWPELPQIRQAIQRQRRLWPIQRTRFKRTGSPWLPGGASPVAEWPGDSVICACLNISKQTLTTLYDAGATAPEQLAERSGASTACGSCRSLLCELAGEQAVRAHVPGATAMLWASILAVVLLGLWGLLPPVPFADSVQSAWRQVDLLWRTDLGRQCSGFTLLSLTVIGLAFSLRKRVRWISFGNYGVWRAIHGILGAAVIAALAIHTGLRLGENMNFVLGTVFLAVTGVGAAAGITSSLEGRLEGSAAMLVRRWRPRLTRIHLWLFWPLPALIAFHILSFYWFSA